MLRRMAGLATTVLMGTTLLVVPASAATGGTGGPATDLKNQGFTASNGLTSRYHIYGAGVPKDRPVGLLIQFHGDGAYEFNNPDSSYSLGGSGGIVAKAKEQDMLVIAALSPDKQGSVTWWEQGSANADYVRDLLQDIAYEQYDIDTENIWLVGYSGGAQFITQFFLPKHSKMIDGGGSVVFGGGGVPRVAVSPFATGLKDDFPMHWYTGAADDGRNGSYNALADANRGSAWYAGQGFATTLDTPAGVGHGGLPFGRVVGEQLAKHQTTTPPPPVTQPPTTQPPATQPPTTQPPATQPPTTQPPTTAQPPATSSVPHTIRPSRTGATVSLTVPARTSRTTFRVSASPFGTQTGWYRYTTRTGAISLSITSSLKPGTRYYYQVETGTGRNVIAAGTFTTTS